MYVMSMSDVCEHDLQGTARVLSDAIDYSSSWHSSRAELRGWTLLSAALMHEHVEQRVTRV